MMKYLVALMILLILAACASRPSEKDLNTLFDKYAFGDTDQPDVDIADEDSDSDADADEENNDDFSAESEGDNGSDSSNDADAESIPVAMECTENSCYDPASSLYWMTTAMNMKYNEAVASCANFASQYYDGKSLWRLPTLQELKNLRRGCVSDGGCGSAATCYWDQGLGSDCSNPFWSSEEKSGSVWTVNFDNGAVSTESNKDALLNFRCVTSN